MLSNVWRGTESDCSVRPSTETLIEFDAIGAQPGISRSSLRTLNPSNAGALNSADLAIQPSGRSP